MEKPEERNIRINKVLRELNISLETAVNYLKENNIIIKSNPNTNISEREYVILFNYFGKKPKEILELENIFGIILEPANNLNQIKIFGKKNTYFINSKLQIIGLNLINNQIFNLKPLEGLTTLTSLSLFNNQITNIKFLEGLKNLTTLILYRNQITDIKPLEGLTALTTLSLFDNQISNIKPLERLTALISLDLYSNYIDDLQPLKGLTALSQLNLSNNQIADIKPLEGLTDLISLDLCSNNITDLQPLKGLTALSRLNLSDNQITDTKPLERLTVLENLNLSDNKITDIKPLEEIITIKELFLFYNRITDIKPLASLTELKTLELGSNKIIDISIISNLIGLKKLRLSNNYIGDYNALKNLNELNELEIANNRIIDFNFLPKSIKFLSMRECQIKDISFIKDYTNLELIDFSYNSITDITPLQKLIKLIKLSLIRNQISDIKPLEGLTALTSLGLSSNQITDIKSLKGLTALNRLDLSHNQIDDINQFEFIKSFKKFDVNIDGNPFRKKIDYIFNQSGNNYEDLLNILQKFDDPQIKAMLPEKIILLGNHTSGKSSLLYYLQNKKLNYPVDDSTHILRIDKYPTKFDKLPKAIFYDFGGQDFYHGIYQAFMTNRATTVLLWDEATNKNEIKPDSKGKMNRNFDVNYWLGERKHKKYEGTILLLQTHSDVVGTKRLSYLNKNEDIEDEFFVSLARNNTNKSNLNKLNYLKKTIDDLIESKQKETNGKGTISEPYYNFLKFILNANPTHNTIKKEILRNEYKVEDNSRFKYDIEQLNAQGLLLIHNENIWLKPEALVEHIHQTILTKEIIGNGVIKKQEFDKKRFDKNIIDMLLANKIIFLHKNGLSKENIPQEEYIIPNFLPLISESGIDYDLMTFGMDNPLFALKFKDYLPFGLINEMICYFGVLPDNKRFWRDQLIFTISEKINNSNSETEDNNKIEINKKVQVLIQLDFENLEIKVYAIFKNGTSKTFNDNVERYLFYSIMNMFINLPILPKSFEEDVLMYNNINININKVNYHHYEKINLFISKNNKHYIDYKKLKDVKENESKIETFVFNNGIKEHYKDMPVAVYQNFTHKELKVMKKIFISYSKSDLTLVNEFQDHLSSLKLDNVISSWYCTELIAGGEWDQEIQQKFDEADIVCFMISSNLMRTDYIHKYEIAKAFERKEKDSKFRIVPIILDFCSWRTQKNNLGDFTALPYTAKPVCDFKNKNMAWFIIVECLKFMIDSDSQPEGDDWFNKPTLPVNIRKLYERIVEGKVDDNSNG